MWVCITSILGMVPHGNCLEPPFFISTYASSPLCLSLWDQWQVSPRLTPYPATQPLKAWALALKRPGFKPWLSYSPLWPWASCFTSEQDWSEWNDNPGTAKPFLLPWALDWDPLMGLEEARGLTLSCRSHGIKCTCLPWDLLWSLRYFEPMFSFVKWRYNCWANVRASSLITEGYLEEVTETPFGWEEGKLNRGDCPSRQEAGGGGAGMAGRWVTRKGGGHRGWAFWRVRGQWVEVARSGLPKVQTWSEKSLLATQLHTPLSTWSHQRMLETHTHIHTLPYTRDIHGVTPRHKDTLRDIHKLIHACFYLQVYPHLHTCSCRHHLHRQANTKAHTCTLKCIHRDTKRNALRPKDTLAHSEVSVDKGTPRHPQ